MNRRTFLGGVAAASMVGLPSCRVGPAYQSLPGQRLRIGLIGVGRQGRRHLQTCLKRSDVEVVAVCDPDLIHLSHATNVAHARGHRALPYRDVRRLLEDPAIQAVVIATPDHWHCLLTCWALAADKHVFVESPATHGIVEGELLAAAMAKTDRRVQAAMPLRCAEGMRRGVEFLHSGNLGEIEWVRTVCFVYRPAIGLVRPGQLPPSLDYDLWAGPAERKPLRRFRLHGDWRFDWSTGSGDIGEWGVHLLDLARWALREELPARVWAGGGRFGPGDAGETPNTLVAGLGFATAPVVFELRNLPAMSRRRARMDQFFGVSLGMVVGARGGHAVFDAQRGTTMVLGHDGQLRRRFDGRGDSLTRFITELRTGAKPFVDLPTVRSSVDLAHLVSLTYRTAPTDAESFRLETVRDLAEDPVVLDSCDSMADHLARRGLDLAALAPHRSGWQAIDPGPAFADLTAANELRARHYRAPYTPTSSLRPV